MGNCVMRLIIQESKHLRKLTGTEVYNVSIYIWYYFIDISNSIVYCPVSCFINSLVKSSALPAIPAVSAFNLCDHSLLCGPAAAASPTCKLCCCFPFANFERLATRLWATDCGFGPGVRMFVASAAGTL